MSLIESLKSQYETLLVGLNPTVDEWLFMKSPLPILTILAFYLYFVLKLGPKLMENRKPFEMQWLLVLYNGYQVVFSAWLCAQVFQVNNCFQYIFNFGCRPPSSDDQFASALWRGAWWYFFSKIVDLLDTVFFVLRKKQNQVSFLHVYHHSITCFFSWGYLKYLPGEQGILLGFLNSFVHIFMYFYYMVAAMGPKYRKYLWWKKYMTWIQLIQFTIMLTYLVLLVAFDCKFSRALTFFFVGNVVIFLYLFSRFYVQAYNSKKASATKALDQNQNGQMIDKNINIKQD